MNKVYIATYSFTEKREYKIKELPYKMTNDDVKFFVEDNLIFSDTMFHYFIHHKDVSDLDVWANRCQNKVMARSYRKIYKMNQIYKFIDFIEKDDDKFAGLLRLRVSQY